MNATFPNAPILPRRLASLLAITFALLGTMTLLNACIPQTFPLQVTDISASPEPIVGQVVTVTVEIQSSEDEPDTSIHVYIPRGVRLVGSAEPYGGEAVWQGSLTANQPQRFDVPVCVLYEGDWRVFVLAISRLSADSAYEDRETIHLISTANSGQAVPGGQYQYTQPAGGVPPRTPLPETPPAGICP